MITPLIDTMKAWIPCVANEDYHRPISVVTAVACAALAVFVTEVEVVSLTCAAITVCTLAIAYKVSMIALSYFITQPAAEAQDPASLKKPEGVEASAPSRNTPSPDPEGYDTVDGQLFKPLTKEPRS